MPAPASDDRRRPGSTADRCFVVAVRVARATEPRLTSPPESHGAGSQHARRDVRHLPGVRGIAVGPGGVGGRPRLADLAEPLGFESIWSVEHHFTRLHDVPRRAAVPHLHGRPHEHGEARLDGAGAALARPGAGRRADRHARPHVQRPAHPRPRPGHGQGRVRRVPRRDGPGPPAVQGVGRGDPRRPRDRRHGVPRRVRRPAAGRAAPGAARDRSRAARTRRPSRPSRPRSWPGSAPAS